ncbi:OLC1v1033073C2 [Oldenlandia corymbosa var. corymbosa]|nr:OLC1v1033073C2 [Oldenlandia corymbosa var. corymbosa]
MLIFEKYILPLSDVNEEGSKSLDPKISTKRRRICGSTENVLDSDTESKDGKCVLPGSQTESRTSDNETSSFLSLVKLIRSGLLLFIFPKDNGPAVVDIVSKIIESRESGSLKSPQWCHRIFPIQSTCNLEEKELHSVVSKLVQQFVTEERIKVAEPVKFAVGYSSRGIEENEMKRVHETSSGSNGSALLDRSKCFSIVAAAVKEVIPDSVVNLKCPEIAVLVEVLPLSGIPNERVMVGVSVLPQMLVSVKPRLCIKALVHDGKAGNEKKKK